jgi:hypothetical protein
VKRNFLKETVTKEFTSSVYRLVFTGPLVYLLAIIVSFAFPILSLFLFVIAVVINFLPHGFDSQLFKED